MKPQAPQSVDFDAPPVLGQVVMFHGQRYELTGYRPYTKQDGSETTLLVWSSHCARCADPFETTSSVKGSLNRRCPDCAQKGVRV